MQQIFTSINHLGEPTATNSMWIKKFLGISVFLLLLGTGCSHFTSGEQYQPFYGAVTWVPKIIGTLLIVAAALLISPWRRNKTLLDLILPMVTLLFAHLSFAAFVHDHYAPEQLLEQGIKVGTPLVYWLFFTQRITEKKCIFLLKVSILCCFVGHGLFAVGLHFVPDSFIDMTTTILGIDAHQAKHVLFVIGILDFIASIAIFFSNNTVFYTYLILWGLLTALARVVYGGLIFDGNQVELANYFFNTVFRIPHGLIPLFVYIHSFRSREKKATSLRG